MSFDDDIDDRVDEYSEAFDYYLEKGSLPKTFPQDDPLGKFIEKVFIENPQLDSQDHTWIEVLKGETMKFIRTLLQLFIPIEKNHKQEKILSSAFATEDIDFKRKMWRNVYDVIKKNYTSLEINIDGYVEQMKECNPNPILSAIVTDWDKASDAKLLRDKQDIIDNYQQKWITHLMHCGSEDYERRKKIERIFFSYPQLADLVRILGREQQSQKEEPDNTILHYLPILLSPPIPAAEVEEIALGNNLQHLIPIETAIMADKQTEDLFFLKYATRKLQLFANKPKEECQKKSDNKKNTKPRLDKGPIIVSIDTSGSMEGYPQQLATSLLLQIIKMAKTQKRNCYLIEFSVRAQCLDLSRPGAMSQLDNFLSNTFSGGTDGEEMLDAALNMLKSKQYSMADILIISDFDFPQPEEDTYARMEAERLKGTRFYGLHIGRYPSAYDNVLDKIWRVF